MQAFIMTLYIGKPHNAMHSPTSSLYIILCWYICYFTLCYTGLATGECANISVSDNNRTIELVNLCQQAQDLLVTVQNGSNDSTIDMLLSITSETNSVIDTTTPLLPNDICIVLDILQTALKYVAICTYVYIILK